MLVVHPSAELYGSDRVTVESVAAMVGAGSAVLAALTTEGPLRERLEEAGSGVAVVPAPVLRKSAMSLRGVVGLAAETARRTPAMLGVLRRCRPHLVYVSTLTVPWWLVLARIAGARVVCHVHEAEEGVPRVVRTLLAAPLLLAHTVVTNSQVSRSVLVADLPRLGGRTRVVYNGVPGPDRVRPPRLALEGPLRLVLVGRVSPRKGTDVAVEALALLLAAGTDAVLELVGGVFPGYEWFEREVRATADRLGVGDRLRWLGVRTDVSDVLAAADVVLVPSRVEPFGNTAVEAMLAERPVIAGDTQGLREIVRDGENGVLVAPGDATALAGAISAVAVDWSAARQRAADARREALARFRPQRYRDDLLAIIAEHRR